MSLIVRSCVEVWNLSVLGHGYKLKLITFNYDVFDQKLIILCFPVARRTLVEASSSLLLAALVSDDCRDILSPSRGVSDGPSSISDNSLDGRQAC